MAGKTTSKAWLFVIPVLLASSTRADPKCYDTWGNEDASQLPCFAPGTTDTNATTWCCNKNDYCLSNGLCLSPGLTQQGCTDKAWGTPCNKICSSSDGNRTTLGIPLIPCPASHNADTNEFQFCCGPDATSCCDNAISWTSIPAGTIIRGPVTSTDSSTSPSSCSNSSSSSSNSYSLKLGLGIGLGIGIPILLVLLGVAYLLAQPIHPCRHCKNNEKNRSKSSGGGGPAALTTTTTTTTTTTEKTPSSSSSSPEKKQRHDSFGRVDTHVGPPSDDGFDNNNNNILPHLWPPAAGPSGSTSMAATLAQWALRSGFGLTTAHHHHHVHGGGGAAPGMGMGIGEMEAPAPPPRPDTPQEMDGRSVRGIVGYNHRRSRSSRPVIRTFTARGGGLFAGSYPNTMTAAPAELPGQSSSAEGVRVVYKGDNSNAAKGRKVRVAAEEVELPTPDTPERERDLEKGVSGKRVGLERGGGSR
ncbi:uncharacterized protein B0T15DRAFT_494027 [Chaetomium strumarium]|uniref:Uncharacterized protein n=1 Tax=Chaetomium strumarium TaxID=1170767 RepID=A0AAJ0GU51_9PEZI|nr:hypothetical protein B0T15DRAFT_494027 [Chaetomium strumarium]